MALTDFDTPQSRVEAILQNALGASNTVYPQSRVEELLVKLDELLEGIDDPEEFERIITDWLEENIEPGAAAVIDKTLTIEGAAADAKIVGTELTGVKRDLNDKAPVIIETASGSIASFSDGADDMPMKSLVVDIDPVQSGSGDPSPDNVRPISGWTGCEVAVTGVNVWDEEWDVGGISSSNGQNVQQNNFRSKNYIPVTAGAEYYVLITTDTNKKAYLFYYDSEKTYIGNSGGYVRGAVTVPSGTAFIRFQCNNSYGYSDYGNDIAVNYPSTDHDYHESHAKSYSISWQSEAGTVYGGTLDVVSGELTVDRAIVDLGTLNWMYRTSDTAIAPYFYADASAWGVKYEGSFQSVVYSLLCSIYKTVGRENLVDGTMCADGVIATGQVTQIQIKDSNYTDAATFKSAMSGVQLVYELATPQTFQLTPTEVKSILGLNNVWADCGDVNLTYCADTKTYLAPVMNDYSAALRALGVI